MLWHSNITVSSGALEMSHFDTKSSNSNNVYKFSGGIIDECKNIVVKILE